ncbi:MAG TPA: acyl-CoA dehydrogenase family protein [Amycolatopsis sp.]|uniref:acyl-CoA dehydrogenase family protein n=1 Tax=Amycolatopsis sp. TaxID=37632 RepID=UPI002B49BE04|nr:acyl-CoA dehydrogenase family protein [Amycolatopsis sp.]HKS45830.1 acyl-CoA dehydrogenase family protein [Amycolatopsis sp.]
MSDDFRAGLIRWLDQHGPRARAGGGADAEVDTRPLAEQKAFQAALHDAGYAGITWPKRYGGQGLTNGELLVFREVARDYDLPVGAFVIGLGMPGETILECGTEEQKLRYLPKMLRGEEIWCQLFSEPGAGSDVAGLRMSAVREGGGWVLNGQKIWTTGAQFSDYGVVLARTDPTVAKHRGLTMFIVDMHAPGVTVRPLRVATGESPFNEVFLDDVRIPADAVLGEVGGGWAVAVVMLRHERESLGTIDRSRGNPLSFDELSAAAAERAGSAALPDGHRHALASLYTRETAVRLLGRLLREEQQAGRDVGARGAVAKLAGAELGHFAGEVALRILGAELAAPATPRAAAVVKAAITARGMSIAGGTNEIQRNVIGERILGLPKDPGIDRETPFNQLRAGTTGVERRN